jgi:hypothetical protein
MEIFLSQHLAKSFYFLTLSSRIGQSMLWFKKIYGSRDIRVDTEVVTVLSFDLNIHYREMERHRIEISSAKERIG